MANHVSHAALPYPVKNARFTIQIPYLDADGDPTDPTTPDTEVSKDGGSYADCAEEISTITGSNGSGYITLTGAETDASMLMLAAKVASGPKATLATLYPRVLPVLFSGTATAGAAGTLTLATDVPAIASLLIGCILKTTGGTGGGGTGGANNQARVITAFTTGRVASVSPNWETTPDNTTTYEVLLTEAAYHALANLIQITGSDLAGNNATLRLKQLDIQNDAGTALVAISTGGNGSGISAAGNGSGHGINGLGGTTGDGIRGAGGATSGAGVRGNGSGSSPGAIFVGGATGNGITVIAGVTSGDGINITTTSGHGISATAAGTAKHGLNLVGAAASGANAGGHGISATGGAATTTGGGTAGRGVNVVGGEGAASTNEAGRGIQVFGGADNGAGGGRGLHVEATGSGSGGRNGGTFIGSGIGSGLVCATLSGTGAGFMAVGGDTGGDGIAVFSTVGHGIGIQAAGSNKDGINITTTAGHGINATGIVGAGKNPFHGMLGAIKLKKNTAQTLYFVMFDSSGNVKTGLVDGDFGTKVVIVDGAAPATIAGSITEEGQGHYSVPLTAAEANGDALGFTFKATGARDLAFLALTNG